MWNNWLLSKISIYFAVYMPDSQLALVGKWGVSVRTFLENGMLYETIAH